MKSRLAVTGDHTAGYYHLSITDVRKSDEGSYVCQLSGTAGSTTQQLTVITNLPSGVLIGNVGLDKKLIGTEGENLIIRCFAVGGVPAPDVKLLISESVIKVAKSSVQFTLSSVHRSYDGQNITCLAGYEEIPNYPFNESARIYLKLKPYPPRFSSDSATTEETKPLVISCTSTGSRPKASIYWFLGDGKINITTNATQSSPSHDSTTDTYSITSTLIYSVDRIYNGKYLICGASNEATMEQGGAVETSIALNITYLGVG
ncbi:cell adhesion molecule 2-like [Mytilus trossulus]|uniref:cell adhesion molecule 2-like n=1 Tax=Mytilus trossulus TaxID=6551 RepID=UPI003003D2ED